MSREQHDQAPMVDPFQGERPEGRRLIVDEERVWKWVKDELDPALTRIRIFESADPFVIPVVLITSLNPHRHVIPSELPVIAGEIILDYLPHRRFQMESAVVIEEEPPGRTFEFYLLRPDDGAPHT